MPYETDIRVPFWAAGPGIAAGTQLHEMISNIGGLLVVPGEWLRHLTARADIGPTLCDLAGIEVPNLMDGRSLVPLLTKGAGKGVEVNPPQRNPRLSFQRSLLTMCRPAG